MNCGDLSERNEILNHFEDCCKESGEQKSFLLVHFAIHKTGVDLNGQDVVRIPIGLPNFAPESGPRAYIKFLDNNFKEYDHVTIAYHRVGRTDKAFNSFNAKCARGDSQCSREEFTWPVIDQQIQTALFTSPYPPLHPILYFGPRSPDWTTRMKLVEVLKRNRQLSSSEDDVEDNSTYWLNMMDPVEYELLYIQRT